MNDNDLLTTLQSNDPSSMLSRLYELLGGREPWPECVTKDGSEWRYGIEILDPQHAHDLVVASCERWLFEQGRNWIRLGIWGYVYTPENAKFTSLPEAIAYAMEQSEQTNTKEK